MIPSTRQQQILAWLYERKRLTIDELVDQLGVSVMTVHRDLDQLTREGQVEKVHGGVLLAGARGVSADTCGLCHQPIQERTAFIIQMQDGDTLQACCPHCGILLLSDWADASSVLARDFIYGRMVNAMQAAYLLESDIRLCCVPSVLCFASQDDAARFQRGFHGQIAAFAECREFLRQQHHSPH